MATISGTNTAPETFRNPQFTRRLVTFSSSYATGGESVTAAQIGLRNVFAAICTPTAATAAGIVSVAYDPPTSKLLAYTATGELAATTNASGVSVECVFLGVA